MIDTVIPLFGPIPGGPELLIILLVLVLLFGANKIPKLARSTGQAMGEFQKGRTQVEEELQEMQNNGKDAATGTTDDEDEEEERTPDIGADTDTDTETETETRS